MPNSEENPTLELPVTEEIVIESSVATFLSQAGNRELSTDRLFYKKKKTYNFVCHAAIKRRMRVRTHYPVGLLYTCPYFQIEVINSETIDITVFEGYAWDGNSGGFTTKTWLIPSLFHDVGYQCMREGILPRSCRGDFDIEMRKMCRDENMWVFRAWYSYHVVKLVGWRYTRTDLRMV